MKLEWDEAKRKLALQHRGLDFADAVRIFEGLIVGFEDQREDYGEQRFVAIGALDDVVVVVVWTPRDHHRRIITMWQANAAERARYRRELGSGLHS